MNIEINTVESARDFAKALRKHCKERAGVNLPVGHSLEVLAGLLGHANWDTLNGLLKAAAPAAKAPVFELKQPVTVYFDAFACDSWGDGPDWARYEVTNQWLMHLRERIDTARALNVDEIRDAMSPDAWDNEDGLRLASDALVVTHRGEFWFRAYPKHVDYAVETRACSLEVLEARLAEAQAQQQSFVVISEGDLMVLLQDIDELQECATCGKLFAGAPTEDECCEQCSGTPASSR